MSGLRANGDFANVRCNRIDWFLTDDGLPSDGSNLSASVNGSVTPVQYYRTALRPLWVHRMIVTIRDGSGIRIGQYGGLAELTNGVKIEILENDLSTVSRSLTAQPIKTNADWGSYCYDIDLKAWGAGDDFVQARWTFLRAGQPLYVAPGQHFVATVQDDLTGLVDHRFLIQGQMP